MFHLYVFIIQIKGIFFGLNQFQLIRIDKNIENNLKIKFKLNSIKEKKYENEIGKSIDKKKI